MSDPQLSNALVSSGGGGASFTQQGSLDWVALGRMQYSTSIAVLGRLAKAGIDPLTVAFGQAMCTRLPIGAHGERALAQAMSTLTAKSCAADLLWFGTGVRHVLRELVQTSQGCSLVALCAALTEGHSITVSALVLYDIAKQTGGPQELLPSLEQWQALVRTAAPAFNVTTFGLRVNQIAKFAPVPNVSHISTAKVRAVNTNPAVPHPTDLAKVLWSIGQVVQGPLQAVSIQGGCCCSWIAAWSDFVLGLRVLVRDENGNVVFANFNPTEASVQINVTFVTDTPNNSMIYMQTSHVIRSGIDFVRHCFGDREHISQAHLTFQPGTLTWDTMFSASFGAGFLKLMENNEDDEASSTGTRSSIAGMLRSSDSIRDGVVLPRRQIFLRLLAIAIIVLFVKSPSISYHGHIRSFLSQVCDFAQELQPLKSDIVETIEAFLAIVGSEDFLLERENSKKASPIGILVVEYFRYRRRLGVVCGCKRHPFHLTDPDQFCLQRIVETIIYVAYMLDRVILDDPIQPKISGLHRLYEDASDKWFLKKSEPGAEDDDSELNADDPTAFFKYLTKGKDNLSWDIARDLAALLVGREWSIDYDSIAQSDGKIYCYSQLVEDLTENIRTAYQVHIGSGTMEFRSRIYRILYGAGGKAHGPEYPAQQSGIVQSIDCLHDDTTSSPITSEIVIDETPSSLYLRHRVSTNSGQILIFPVSFLRRLRDASDYRCSDRIPSLASRRWNEVLQGQEYIKIEGEGLVDESKSCHMLRPLRGNVLGRGVAISKSKGPVALVRSRHEVELFAQYWCRDCEERKEAGKEIRYFALIS